jgi:hypothetical protein
LWILGEDDTAEHVVINEPVTEQVEQNGQMVAIERVMHDMSVGKYDVTVSSGPSFTTMRQESAEFYTNAMQAAKDPVTAAVVSYLAIKNQDVPYSDLAAKLIKSTLPPAQQQIIDEETGGKQEEKEPVVQLAEGPLPLSQVPQAIETLKGQIVQAQEAIQKADVAKQEAELLKQQNDQAAKALDAERVKIEQFNAETERWKAMQAAEEAQRRADEEQVKLLQEDQRIQIEAEQSKGAAIAGDGQAFEAWKATLESQTKIRVAEIMAASRDRSAALMASRPKIPEKRP